MTRISPAAKGGTVLTEGGHLKEPLGMVLAPNGNIITSNGGDGNMVETTPAGQQVAVQSADRKTGAGSLFGLVIAPEGKGIYFVDDGENTLNLLHEGQPATPTTSSTAASPTPKGTGGKGTHLERHHDQPRQHPAQHKQLIGTGKVQRRQLERWRLRLLSRPTPYLTAPPEALIAYHVPPNSFTPT